jgi:hypothetical protein
MAATHALKHGETAEAAQQRTMRNRCISCLTAIAHICYVSLNAFSLIEQEFIGASNSSLQNMWNQVQLASTGFFSLLSAAHVYDYTVKQKKMPVMPGADIERQIPAPPPDLWLDRLKKATHSSTVNLGLVGQIFLSTMLMTVVYNETCG